MDGFIRRAGRGAWENKVTLRSLDYRIEFDALPFMQRISPTPLLMIVASDDTITPTSIAIDAFEHAHAPKKLLMIEGHHYVPYRERFGSSSEAARDWFVAHLINSGDRQ